MTLTRLDFNTENTEVESKECFLGNHSVLSVSKRPRSSTY
jgi:hypothetical protein